MTLAFLVIFSFLPLAVWSFLAVRFHGVSTFRLGAAVFSGFAAIACASVFQVFLDPVTVSVAGVGGIFFSAFIESSLVEELSKLGFVRFVLASHALERRDSACQEPARSEPDLREFLSCAVALGLAFSAFETVAYSIRNPSVLLLRTLTALPVHASTALAAGFLVAASRPATSCAGTSSFAGSRDRRYANAPVIFFVAVLLHGVYNLCLSLGGMFPVLSLPVVAILLGLAVHVWKKADGQ